MKTDFKVLMWVLAMMAFFESSSWAVYFPTPEEAGNTGNTVSQVCAPFDPGSSSGRPYGGVPFPTPAGCNCTGNTVTGVTCAFP